MSLSYAVYEKRPVCCLSLRALYRVTYVEDKKHRTVDSEPSGVAILIYSSMLFVLQTVQNGRLQQTGHTLLILPDLGSRLTLRDNQSLAAEEIFFLAVINILLY